MATERAVVLDFASLVAAASAVQKSCRHDGTDSADILPGAEEVQYGGEVVSRLMAALGPDGPGLVAVSGVPQCESLRKELLPMARALALMPRPDQIALLKDNGLGTDVPLKTPNRAVSSFAAQLQFDAPQLSDLWDVDPGSPDGASVHRSLENDGSNDKQIGSIFRQLGLCMVKLGLLVASLCDLVVHGAGLETAILSAGTAKGRLIHYHAAAEQRILASLHNPKQQVNVGKRTSKVSPGRTRSHAQDGRQEMLTPAQQEWQDWHFDYGVFTILTAPLFCKLATVDVGSCDILKNDPSDLYNKSYRLAETCPSPCGHSLLRILHAPSGSLKFMDIPPDCLVIQVGEAAQILSGGMLRATAHCVCRPPGGEVDISRETLAVFLQPPWDKALVPPSGFDKTAVLQANAEIASCNSSPAAPDLASLDRVIPPLCSRWTEGCSFAEFSRNTTRQYYGAAGRQHSPSS